MESVSTEKDLLTGFERRYDNPHDASLRLNRTIVRFKGEPVYVKDVMENADLIVWDMREGSSNFQVSSNDRRLDVTSIPLGYFDNGERSIYLFRAPSRSQTQGVRLENTGTFTPFFGFGGGVSATGSNLVGLGKALRGVFTPISEAIEASRRTIAIGRVWCLARPKDSSLILLFHRTTAVGVYMKKEKTFLFRKGMLTELRRRSFDSILSKQSGAYYSVQETH